MILPSCYCLHDDYWFLATSIEAVKRLGPVVCFVSKRAWDGSAGDFQRVIDVAEAAGAEVVLGDWPDEALHRSTALAVMKDRGHKHILIPDGDEVPDEALLATLVKIAEADLADVVRVRMDTYWKDAAHVIRPRENLAPILLLNAQLSQHDHIREYTGERLLILGPEYGLLHHLSYAGPDERIQRKIGTWGHRHEVTQSWYMRSWKGWEADPLIRDLHPTHPSFYGAIEHITPIPALAGLPRWRADEEIVPQAKWPKVSVVIPLHGGPEDIDQCMESLEKCKDLLHEVIVVDDASPDNAAEVLKGSFATVIQNEKNEGFAKTCNRGYDESTGDAILFLNSDTIVPRAGLIRLIEGLMESGTVGAAGPVSNNVSAYQKIDPTYTDIKNLDLFANDLALSDRENKDVELLIGFALAVRRSVLEEVGLFDERFGRGMYEDNDLCYRILRAGYRLKMVSNAYIHHWGSRTLRRVIPDPIELLNKNGAAYKEKWRADLESGYASHLPGLGKGLVVFDSAKHPEKISAHIAKLAKQADISLCMIVKNEERVLADCLRSAKPFFKELIVVDTGSTDRTIEIAREAGATVYEVEWQESFSTARNESLKYATGKWIFWMDADDTLPAWAGERVVQMAINAPKEVAGFIVPVQFVEDGPGAGTRVDHVKLLRNVPGLAFEGRIHEQVLGSLRPHGGIARIEAVVLHSGYDTSPEGQRRKRIRDARLLRLDLEERPNHPFVLFNLGMTAHFTFEHEEAVEWLRKSIANSGKTESHLRKAYGLMGVSLRELGRVEEALEAFKEGIECVGDDAELRFQLALTLASQKDYVGAKASYEAMDLDISSHFSSVDISILTFKRSHNLGQIEMLLGNYTRARELLLQALQENPSFAPAAFALFEAGMSVGDYRTARESLDHIERAEGPTVDWCERVATLAESVGKPGDGFQALKREVESRPNAPGPALAFARALLQAGQVKAAEPFLLGLEAAGVAEAAFFLGVAALQQGDFENALRHTERSVYLNPAHQQSREQLEKLKKFFDEPTPSPLSPEAQQEILRGPHIGKLGAATKRFSIVIVTYNSEKWIQRCLQSVLPTLGEDDEVIVIDNASADQTLALTQAVLDARVHIVANAENEGYSKAANRGALASKGSAIVFLNPDTEVYSGWLERLAIRLESGVGAVGPLADSVAGDQFVGYYLPIKVSHEAEGLAKLVEESLRGQTKDTKFLTGLALMVPRAVLDTYGLLDEEMFLGADDLELSWRLRSIGLALKIAQDVYVRHIGHASFETRPTEETSPLIAKSDAALLQKLTRFYAGKVPCSYALWGMDIFTEAMSRKK